VIVSLLKFVKKIGRYNRKIGVCIGGLDSRNFAHLCSIHIFFYLLSISPAESIFRANIFLLNQLSLFFLFHFITRLPVLLQLFFCPKFCMEKGVNYTPIKDVFHQLENRHTHLQFTRFSRFGMNEKSKTQGDTVNAIVTVQRAHSWT
jgi:hypothetical protein